MRIEKHLRTLYLMTAILSTGPVVTILLIFTGFPLALVIALMVVLFILVLWVFITSIAMFRSIGSDGVDVSPAQALFAAPPPAGAFEALDPWRD